MLLSILLTVLGSCDRTEPLPLPARLAAQNVPMKVAPKAWVLAALTHDSLPSYTIVTEHLTVGLLVMQNSQAQRGVFSLAEWRIIVPLEYSVITVQLDGFNGAYLFATNQEGMQGVFDVAGKEIVPFNHYQTLEVIGDGEPYTNDQGQVIGWRHFEEIHTLTQEAYDNGEREPNVSTFAIDLSNGTRTVVDVVEEETMTWGKNFADQTMARTSLESFGLPGYSHLTIDGVMHVYDPTGQLVSHVSFPSSLGAKTAVFGGHFLYQREYQVPDDSVDFDYILNNRKYRLRTYTIDLKTGEENSLNLPYRIETITPWKDEKGVVSIAEATLYHVANGTLANERLHRVLINTQGEQLSNLQGIHLNRLDRLDENTYYDRFQRLVLDENLEPQFFISTIPTFNYQEGLILFRHNQYVGAVSYDGTIKIPFSYQTIRPQFHQGYTLAQNEESAWCIINLNQFEQCLNHVYEDIFPTGVVVKQLNMGSEGGLIEYEYQVFDYQQAFFIRLKSKEATPQHIIINNPFTHVELIVFSSFGIRQYIVARYE